MRLMSGRLACRALAAATLATFAIAATLAGRAEAVPGGWTAAQVQTHLEEAVGYIDTQHNANGSYGASAPTTETGMALVAYGVLANGNFASLSATYQTHVKEAIAYLLSVQKANGAWADGTYETYGTGIVLGGLAPFTAVNAAVPAAIVKGRAFLINEFQGNAYTGCSSLDASPTANYCGGWNYEADKHRSDESNTGFALFGLHQTGGVPALIAAQNHNWQRHIQQFKGVPPNPFAGREDGGGSYQPGTNAGSFSSNANDSGSMLFGYAYDGVSGAEANVLAGIKFGEDVLDEYELEAPASHNMVYHEGVAEDGTCTIGTVSPACDWQFSGGEGGFHYSLFALAKGLGAYVPNNLADGTNWYAKLVDLLLSEQHADGSWPKDGRDDNSALLASAFSVGAIGLVGTGSGSEYETQTVVSSAKSSFCENPTSGFAPTVGGKFNYAPLTTPSGTGEAFPEGPTNCGEPKKTHPVAVGAVGAAAGPWHGSIPGAQWVGIAANGSDLANAAPKYYIYDSTFELCENQVAGAKIEGLMFADNQAGAFLNGEPIGHQPTPGAGANFNGPPAAGWPFGPGANFKTGVNTLQFVVFDESISFTGLDYSATVTAPPCKPHWYSNGKLIKEGQSEPVATSGSLTMHAHGGTIACKLKDHETIENPTGGGAGTDEMTEFNFSFCTSKLTGICPEGTKAELVAGNLPWKTEETWGPPARDVIEEMEIVLKCSNGTVIETYTGSLSPSIGKSTLTFGTGSGELNGPGNVEKGSATATFTGTDKLKGPPGDEEITASKGKGVVVKTEKGVLGGGTPIEAVSHNAKLVTTAGNIECTAINLPGMLEETSASIDTGKFTAGAFSGEGEGGACSSTTGLGPAQVSAAGLPWSLSFSINGLVEVKGTSQVTVTSVFPTAGNATCIFESKALKGAFNVGGQMAISLSGQVLKRSKKGSNPACPSEGRLSGSFALNSEGQPIEASIE